MLNQTHRRTHTPTAAILLLAALFQAGCSKPVGESTPEPPQRIVSLVPSVTEMLFELGAGNRVVGVSDFDAFPPAVRGLPRVGGLLDPDLETILALEADLVVTYGSQSALALRLDAAGIRTFSFVSGSIDDMLRSMGELGVALGDPEAGVDLAEKISGQLEALSAPAPARRPTVLLVHSRDPGVIGTLYSEGGPSYLTEVIRIAGGDNVFADVTLKSFQPSLEEILERNPDVIVELVPSSGGSPEAMRQRRQDWERLGTLPAVQTGRVYVIAGDYMLVLGPRLPLVARRLRDVIRP